MHDDLDSLEAQSIYILREAYSRIKPMAMLWSLGKDSNVMIWLARKAFLGKVPFPLAHLDTGLEFPETYAVRDRYTAEWGIEPRFTPRRLITPTDESGDRCLRSDAASLSIIEPENHRWKLPRVGV